jgi:outer membrane murein-binding lipoprotein Lpp
MKLLKIAAKSAVISVFAVSTILLSGCGGVSQAQMEELRNLRAEVNALESEANALREERSRLERDIADRNAKLQQCARDKEETRANLENLPQ